jgi:hypothetical protein
MRLSLYSVFASLVLWQLSHALYIPANPSTDQLAPRSFLIAARLASDLTGPERDVNAALKTFEDEHSVPKSTLLTWIKTWFKSNPVATVLDLFEVQDLDTYMAVYRRSLSSTAALTTAMVPAMTKNYKTLTKGFAALATALAKVRPIDAAAKNQQATAATIGLQVSVSAYAAALQKNPPPT